MSAIVRLKVLKKRDAMFDYIETEVHKFDNRAEALVYINDCIPDKAEVVGHYINSKGNEHWELDYWREDHVIGSINDIYLEEE